MTTVSIIIILALLSLVILLSYFIYPYIKRDLKDTEERLHLLNTGKLQIPDEKLRADLEEGRRNSIKMLNSIPTSINIGNPQI